MSPILTPASLGYRKLGDLPQGVGSNPSTNLARALVSGFDYEALHGSTCLRLPARRRGRHLPEALVFVRTIAADSVPQEEELAFIPKETVALHEQVGVPRLVAEHQDELTGLVDSAVGRPDKWLALAQIGRAVIGCEPGRLPGLLARHVFPTLFRMYPSGILTIWRYDADSPGAFGALRFLYAAALLPLSEVKGTGFRGFQSQQEALHQNVFSRAPVLFDFLSYLFFPFVGGFHFSNGPFLFMFLFDMPEEITAPPFPSDWLSLPRWHAGFAREQVELLDVLRESASPARSRVAFQKAIHLTGFSVEDRLTLLRWLVQRFNRLAFELNDVCNFLSDPADINSEVEPIGAFEHLLTVDRLSRSTLLAMSHTEPTAARAFTFEVADLYGELAKRHQNIASTGLTKKLLNPAEAPGLLKPLLAQLPAPFDAYFSAQADDLYARLEKGVIDSVWVRNRVTPAGVRVKARDLRTDETIGRGEFVAELLRATRNAHHGYLSDARNRQMPARFLAISDGNLPPELSSLPALWWLAYCADPALVGWNHLPVDHFPD